jgi:ornithine cyclodeaminase/alanine dehydrogenase-like protein (mu-crystallin family)
LTLVLSERDVESLLEMTEVLASIEEAFKRQAHGEAVNSVRTRSWTPGAVLNVMQASLPYLGRGGIKCYMSSRRGTRFVLVLFDSTDSRPLAMMGADVLGRFRTGAASGVATKFLYGRRSAKLAVCGSGRQAMTQVLAVAAVTSVSEVRVWSPNKEHRDGFCQRLKGVGLDAEAFGTPREALTGADVVSTITSSRVPFLDAAAVHGLSHLNICGSNLPKHSEVTAAAVSKFGTVVVDDLPQAKIEYGDLIQAVEAGTCSWNAAVELKDVVAGRVHAKSPTLFKSGGVALEDVAVGSMIYDKALKSGRFPDATFDLA